MNTNQAKRPWTNEQGKDLAKDELKELCSGWDTSTWENYLSAEEVEQKELLLDDPAQSENFSQEKHDHFIESHFDQKEFPNLKKKMCSLIRELSDKQQTVIYKIFWENKCLTTIAEEMNVNKTSVMKLRDRGLHQLAKKLLQTTLKSKAETMSPEMNHAS